MVALLVFVTAVCVHLAIRLHAAKVEIVDLRTNIAHLKRRLNLRS
jgi:hypothetical protein